MTARQNCGRVMSLNSCDGTRQSCALHLVTFGLRGWMSGLRNADVAIFESVFKTYQSNLGLCHARNSVMALAGWVRAIDGAAVRPIELAPLTCHELCEDECLAVSLVAAAQVDTCPAMRACAITLLGHPDVEPVVQTTAQFASVLASANCRLPDVHAIPRNWVGGSGMVQPVPRDRTH
ncbi:MAG: hypothetical protein AAFY27_05605 [Pseudomonadota bacterium]